MSPRTTLHLQKACDCDKALASGPRIVLDGIPQPDGSLLIRSRLVRFACLSCNTEWREVDQ